MKKWIVYDVPDIFPDINKFLEKLGLNNSTHVVM